MKLPHFFKNNERLEYLQNRAIVILARFFRGIDHRKIVFMSFRGRSYNDNPRVISERLHERCPEAKIVWIFKDNVYQEMKKIVPDYVQCLNTSARRRLIELATARVWVDNFTKDLFLRNHPRGRQFYIQTWHGDRPIKKICYDLNTPFYRIEEECDLVLTGSELGQKVYRTAFRYKGEYMNMGSPRNDILVRNDPIEAAAVREKLGVEPDTKLLLYAPTYRETSDIIPKEAQMDLQRTLDLLESRGEKWKCLYRAHYLSKGIDIDSDARLIDVSQYDNMSDLLLISDMLLTDYSSCAMDFCLLDRPVFMFMADYDDYLASREVYYDPHDTPLLIAHTQAELENLIRTTDAKAAKANCAAIRQWYGITETGHATDAVCDYIIERLK